jgi:hypothetical protein
VIQRGTRTRVVVVAALAAGAALGGFALLRARGPAVSPEWAFRLAPGTTLVYQFSHRTSTALSLAAGRGVEGGSDFVGELRLRGLEAAHEGTVRAAASFAALTRHEVIVLGKSVLADDAAARAQLEGHEAVIELGGDGALQSLAAPPDAGPLFGNTMQLVLADLAVTVQPGQRHWLARQTTPRGTAEIGYATVRRDGPLLAIGGTHRSYAQLVGMPPGAITDVESTRLAASLHDDGRIETLEAQQRLRTHGSVSGRVEVTAALRFLRAEDAAAAPPRAGTPIALGALPRGPELDAALLDQKIEGLTGDELVALLERFGATGVVPDHNRFLVRATSLLRKDPALSAALLRLFERPEATLTGQLLVLDLFVGAGTPAAQRALLTALDSRAARASDGFPQMLGRAALLAAPTEDTQAWLEATYRARPAVGTGTAALALGAVAGRRARAHGDAASRRALDELVHDLARAANGPARADLLQALGNAAAPELVGAVTPWAADPSPDVRRATADALRGTQTPESEAVLLRLARDGADGVQGTALGALGTYALDAALLGKLRDEALPAIVAENKQRLVTLVGPYAAAQPAARDILGTVAADERVAPQTRARARKLLAASRDG